ncbi:MAG: DUF5110 domain-containing protein, partial [Planctomycetota bacterium]
TLYEDDGASYDYEKGVYASTMFRCMEHSDGVLITKSAPRGSYKVPERDHMFAVHKQMKVNSVRTGRTSIPHYDSRAEFDSAAEGWFYDSSSHIIWAKIIGGANELISVAFLKDRTGP